MHIVFTLETAKYGWDDLGEGKYYDSIAPAYNVESISNIVTEFILPRSTFSQFDSVII